MVRRSEVTQMRQAAVMVVLVLLAELACAAQSADVNVPSVEERLAGLAERTQLALSAASVAVFCPTLRDAHGQAERLLVLLRGNETEAVLGLVPQAAALSDWVLARSFEPGQRDALLRAASGVQEFLRLGVKSTLAASRARSLSVATDELRTAYACLLAAWGQPVDGIVVPGLLMILHAFGASPAGAG